MVSKLFTQVHTPVFIQLPEIRITQIFNKPDRFARTFHFRSQFFIYTGKFIKAEHRFFNCKTFQFFLKLEIFQFMLPIIILVAIFR